MKNKTSSLRKRATEFLDKNPKAIKEITSGDVKKLVEDLHVHQIELEIQNEELRRNQLELEVSRDMHSDLYDFSPVGYVTISEKGSILQAIRCIKQPLHRNVDMTESKTIKQPAPTGWRFRFGLSFFVLGWICPLFVPFVTRSNLSTEIKTIISGVILIGGPEILSVISIIFLGKSGFNYIKSKVFAFLKLAMPRGKVSRVRYRIGLLMLLLHVINANLIFYAPHLILGYAEHRIAMGLIADLLFVVTLFVLGGEFWEKLRALLLYEAKAFIPLPKS